MTLKTLIGNSVAAVRAVSALYNWNWCSLAGATLDETLVGKSFQLVAAVENVLACRKVDPLIVAEATLGEC